MISINMRARPLCININHMAEPGNESCRVEIAQRDPNVNQFSDHTMIFEPELATGSARCSCDKVER